MEYITLCEYMAFYGEPPKDFDRLSYDASSLLDYHTTGADGYRKLKEAFPVDEDGIKAVKRCACELVKIMSEINNVQKTLSASEGVITREDGSVHSKVISSISAGNESVSYAALNSKGVTEISAAAVDSAARDSLLNMTIKKFLYGVQDANGVNLLYMGTYPRFKNVQRYCDCF